MNSILTSINLVKTEYSEADFYNFWQLASEMVGLDVQDKKLAKIIEAIHNHSGHFSAKQKHLLINKFNFPQFFPCKNKL